MLQTKLKWQLSQLLREEWMYSQRNDEIMESHEDITDGTDAVVLSEYYENIEFEYKSHCREG